MPQIYDTLLPLRRKVCWGFFHPKNPTASAGFEPANLGTKGQHATPRPPNPPAYILVLYTCQTKFDNYSVRKTCVATNRKHIVQSRDQLLKYICIWRHLHRSFQESVQLERLYNIIQIVFFFFLYGYTVIIFKLLQIWSPTSFLFNGYWVSLQTLKPPESPSTAKNWGCMELHLISPYTLSCHGRL